MSTNLATNMQPDSSITFISSKNKRIWAGRRRDFARHDEVLEHLARQAGVPPLPQWKETRRIKAYISYAHFGAFFTGVFVLGLAIAWCIAVEFWRYLGDRAMGMGLAAVIAVVLITYPWHIRHIRDQFVYPSCILKLYRQLIDVGQITRGEVQSTETLPGSKCLINYHFTLPTHNQPITGRYVTDRQFPAGTKMAVIYLDANCHALL